MKKVTAAFAMLVLLVGLLTVGVSADGFEFREMSRQWVGTSLQITWNSNEATADTEIEDILIGGNSFNFTMKDDKTLEVDTSDLAAGVYTVTYEYVVGATQKTATGADLIMSGVANVTLSAVINGDGTVTVTAKNASGAPIAGYDLLLTIGNMSGITGKTNANGAYTSYITAEIGQTVTYEGKMTTVGEVTYAATAQQSVKRQQVTTTTTTVPTTTATTTTESTDTTETTTTEESTETTTTVTESTTTVATTTVDKEAGASTTKVHTNETVLGAGTTAIKDGKVVINVSTDEAVLQLFGCDANAFAGKARLFMSQDDYTGLIGRNNDNLLMLNVLTSNQPVSETQLRAALADASAFAGYAETERTWITFDLSFLILDKAGNTVPVSAMPIDSTYTVELPVPASMKKCDELAITLMDGDGLMTPVKVAVSGGTFKLQINALEPYTLIGFGAESSGNAGGVSIWVVLLFVAGILLLAGAGVLLYLFVLRKPAPAAQSKAEDEEAAPVIAVQPEDDGNDIYSGRTDMPPTDKE